MSTDLDRAVREAFHRLGAVPPPVGIGPAVVRRVRRENRVRMAVTTGALVALVAAAVPLGLGAAGGNNSQFGGATSCPLVVSAYSTTDPQDATTRSLLRNATGTYIELPYQSVVPSPDGTRVLVQAGQDTSTSPLRSGILDPTDPDAVRWIDRYTGPGSWSPDGTEILFTVAPRLGDQGFAIVDAVTLKSAFAKVDLYADNTGAHGFVWADGGNQVARTITQDGGESQADQVTGIRFYDRSGRLARTLPATAALTSADAFSPDGTRIALHNPLPDAPIRIVATDTGAAQRTIRLSGQNQIIAWIDDEHLVLRHWTDGFEGSEVRAVNLAGQVVQVVPLRPDAVTANDITVTCS
ncbi:hypothetical protein ABNF97_09775 [Plantactinospora sp. B6F1]|uniref:hypothetical protein n=1 Tax=Plantactinospora sp. B6F1 TaxID=3158971 RepID=UPI0032D8D02D